MSGEMQNAKCKVGAGLDPPEKLMIAWRDGQDRPLH